MIDLQDLRKQLSRGPGLVIGPGLSSSLSTEAECFALLRREYPGHDDEAPVATFLEYVDLVIGSGLCSAVELQKKVVDYFSNTHLGNPQLPLVVKANWTVVASLVFDDFFRMHLRDHLNKTPLTWPVTTVASPVSLGPRTLPYYALLGDIQDARDKSKLVTSASQYLTRSRGWGKILETMPHFLKADPLIFIGTSTILDRTCDFMNQILGLAPQIPKRLVFLKNDATALAPKFRNLVSQYCHIEVADCSLADIGDLLSRDSIQIYSLPLFADSSKQVLDLKSLDPVQDQVVYVPRKSEVEVNPSERNRLLDTLFRPSQLDWGPYALDMEFKRDTCQILEDRIRKSFDRTTTGYSNVIELKGEAGIGKTVVARSVAFKMAQVEDCICLWIRNSYEELSSGQFDAVVTAIRKSLKKPKSTKVVLWLDDPRGSRVRPKQVLSSLQAAQFQWALVISSRKTDSAFATIDDDLVVNVEDDSIEVEARFSDAELLRLPIYLVSLGVAKDLEQAKSLMVAPGMSRNSRDVLCELWYALPQTRAAIEDSLVGEYLVLGGGAQIAINAFVQAAGPRKAIARAAYEMVTTTSGLDNTPLPMEVLVSALGVSYVEWSDHLQEKKPLWGLLYDEAYPSAQTFAYRTRNDVVTQVLLRTLNTGSGLHAGEFRCLKRMLAACTSTLEPYKAFVMDVLINKRDILQQRFNHDQIIELYDTALTAFPAPLGSVEHHKWVASRKTGGDPSIVYDELLKLLNRVRDQAESGHDHPANLHTSAAAAMRQMIKEGRIEVTEGMSRATEHITKSLNLDQFSLHTHHIHADTLLAISTHLRGRDTKAFHGALEMACRISDRALLLVKHSKRITSSDRKTVELFNDIRHQILIALPDWTKAKQEAEKAFIATGSQTSLSLVARTHLAKAVETENGQDFKKADAVINSFFTLIERENAAPADELFMCRIELVANWKIFLGRGGPIYWEGFENDLKRLLGTRAYGQDAYLIFLLAVALYNQKRFTEAEACFQSLRGRFLPRDVATVRRCWFQGLKSEPAVFEGTLTKQSEEKAYIFAPELGMDVPAWRKPLLRQPHQVKHFKIGFSMQGAAAYERDFQNYSLGGDE